jgi:dTDP-4-amino-4,6-dideoxygalactose transaminase
LAARYGADHAVLCGSGTQALTLALRHVTPRGARTLVALPAYACYDLVSAAVGAEARVVFYDVDPATLGPEPGSLQEVCALGPDAVVVAPLFGIPVDWDRVTTLVRPCGAVLIEDAAQGLGAEWNGRPVGSWGDMSVLSFGRGKGWTGGVGGALLLRGTGEVPSPRGAARSTTDVAVRAAVQWLLGRPETYWIPAALPWLHLGETNYHPPVDPAPIPGLAAALILAHEEVAWAEVPRRRANAALLEERIGALSRGLGIRTVRPCPGGVAGYLRFPVLTPSGTAGLAVPGRARALGIMSGYPMALSELPEARPLIAPGPPITHAEQIARQLITLPTHSKVSEADATRALEALSRYGVTS